MDLPASTEAPSPMSRLISLFTLSNKKEDAVGKRTRPLGTAAKEPTPLSHKKPPQNDPVAEPIPPAIHAEFSANSVRRSCQKIQWTRGPLPRNVNYWFYDLREVGTVPPESLVAASRAMVLNWKSALGQDYFPFGKYAGGSVLSREPAHRTFKALTRDMPISGWVSRACAKHEGIHGTRKIPLLVAKEGDPLTTRPCLLIYYYEQLLEDMKHIVTNLFEVIPRTILTPIPTAKPSAPSRKSRSAPAANASSAVTSTGSDVWRTQRKKRIKQRAPTADDHFQELAKDIHANNMNISNPYEHEDAEQYKWAFDSLMSDEKKVLVKRSKRMISLIKANEPPKNYIERRTNKLRGEPRD
jgi:hypothetical protein